ncbi:unnamed protein product [Caenorhabditis bovis]|uniref:Serpentine receptor class gamma n=1 Tax=Caenorhabditis bovis TaxID=2654633 RepID=A0A8S1EC60_9PELO|nr:unnamed protein product [Caenorhabditis bovis]
MFRSWKDFSASFFKIYIFEYFVNIVTFLNSFVTLRLPQNTCSSCLFAPWFNRLNSEMDDISILLNICHNLHISLAYVQYSIIFIFSINRFTMIFSYSSYEKDRTRIKSNLSVFIFVVTLITLWCNIVAFLRLTMISAKISVAERNLLFASFATFLIQLSAGANAMAFAFLVDESNMNTFWGELPQILKPYVSDALTLCQPWTLLIFSKKNLLTFLNSFITLRIPQYTCKECYFSTIFKIFNAQMEHRVILINICHTLHIHMAYVQYGTILLAAINRFTMIFWFRSYEAELTKILSDLLIFIFVVTLFTAMFNVAALIKFAMFPVKITAIEKNLLYTSFSTFVIQFFAGTNTLALTYLVTDSNLNTFWGKLPQQLSPYVSDALTLCQPWALLIFSPKIRNSFSNTYLPSTRVRMSPEIVDTQEPRE